MLEGRSRTPAVAAYSTRDRGVEPERALNEVLGALPRNHLHSEFSEAVLRDIRP